MVLSEASFEELQELFEVVVNFKDPEMLDKLTDLNDLSSSLSADQVAEALLQVMPNCTDFIKECHWQGSKEDCSSIFELRKTDDGFCCSFNALRQSEIVDLSDRFFIFQIPLEMEISLVRANNYIYFYDKKNSIFYRLSICQKIQKLENIENFEKH